MPADPEIVKLGIEPIAGASGAGVSVRYDPEFEQLDAEIGKMQLIRENAPKVDWNIVIQLSASILKAKSKDYRVASYLVMALYQTTGVQGLIYGFRLYTALMGNFWETAFPEKTRLRARAGALEWLNDQLGISLTRDARKPVSDELDFELEKTLQEFLSALNEHLGDQAPGFVDVRRVVEARAGEVRARQAAIELEKEEEARRAAAVASGEVGDVDGAEKVVEECRDKLSRVAGYLFQADPTAALSYLLKRSITWGWLVAAPTNENGVTQIPPVGADAVHTCNSFWGEGKWIELVSEIESNFFDRVFAFEFQRRCIQALTELGEPYEAPRRAILSELHGLLTRLPEILHLKFNDSSPFADSQTLDWIAAEVLQTNSSPHPAREDAPGGEELAELAEAVLKARKLVSAGKLQEAIALFRNGITKAPLRRFRFLWRLQLAKLCMEAGKMQLALPQLTSLDEDVGRFSLEEWEPGLSLEVVQNLFLCRQKLAAGAQGQSADVENHLAQLYQRLCKLDVNAALAVES